MVVGLDAGLLTTMVNTDVPFTAMGLALNDLLMSGGACTTKLAAALDVLKVDPSVWPLYDMVAEFEIAVPDVTPALTVVSNCTDVDAFCGKFPPLTALAPAPSRKMTQGEATGAHVAGTLENSA